jgi:2-polyprenyl-6-methoxyphenol hydroxylase-like FAD-dependent oxidoreductase
MLSNGSRTHFEVAVIGAGQAGLAIGCLLGRQDRRFVILDGADSIGAAWRDRWDSLVLFTPGFRPPVRNLRRRHGAVLRPGRQRGPFLGSAP